MTLANSTNNNIPNNQVPPITISNHVVNKPAVNVSATSHGKQSINNDKQISVPIQSIAPTIPQTPKLVVVPTPSPDKPNVISPLASTYTDPIEKSLASLEHDIIKSEPIENNISAGLVQMPPTVTNPMVNPNMNPNPNLITPVLQPTVSMDMKPSNMVLENMLTTNSILHGMHSNVEHELSSVVHPSIATTNMVHSTNNGFNVKHEYDLSSNNNGLSSIGIPMNMSIPSMFDPLPQQIPKKEPLLQPKPIEELTASIPNLIMDRKTTPPEQKHSQSFTFKPKQEQNVKNASSWFLGQPNSPQNNTPSGSNSRQHVMDSFKAFRNKAIEKADREKQRLENLELKRQQKEQAEKERLRVENERRREREEEDALEKAR